ncbi:hypothetical protein [Legionella gresilensis]|uniref:hypothetical protein n=1 Tax=Legionella gresilensis TaxID=91823 RepID=UPI001041B5AC|nr:hypothetical protein [Legionella gresilensis]
MKNPNLIGSIDKLRELSSILWMTNNSNQSIEQLKINAILNRNCLSLQQKIIEQLANEIQKEDEHA